MKINFKTKPLKDVIPLIALLAILLLPHKGYSQAEFTTWGNMTGIRVNNQLMEFNSSLAIENQWGETWRTRKEGQQIDFERKGAQKIFSYEMRDIEWKQTIETTEEGKAEVEITFTSPKDTLINAAYFSIALPEEFGTDTKFSFISKPSIGLGDINIPFSEAHFKAPAQGITVQSPTRTLNITFQKSTEVVISKGTEENPQIRVNLVLASGEIAADNMFRNTFVIRASGEIDTTPLTLQIFPDQEGKVFDGIGGNFRLQNAQTDPQVIDYSLENLNVTWSRVEMPWREWHAKRTADPAFEAKRGNLHPKVKAAMEMAQRLDQQGIPVMLAAWFAPEWAIIGKPFKGKHPDGSMGNRLDLTKKEEIYRSLTSYIKFLKEEYGVETILFSFNESDLGIDVRQTAEEHNDLIKELGAMFRAEGLQTEFLLGDTADLNGWDFTTLASMDPESRPYIGGVSFHSWRGWTDENLIKWRDISNRVNEPLFVGEGSIDAGAWRYPQIFEEPTYALDEIDVYIKIMNIAQPKSILQWQLTADYSVLSGGGIFGNNEDELYPTQRFFNLQQLGATPEGLYALPVKADQKNVSVAALGDKEKGQYAIHLVNKGATRNVELSGLPAGITSMDLYITNKKRSFEKTETIQVEKGRATFSLEGAGFTSLMTPN
ncbi:hypothetical protein GCM10007103_24040 [Salinimicrobium marinum]|uniref:O-Glycosyl hydrolase n=1 Tax=Salinimicrobium marinum TaxID=680283 RepID=A0A918SHE4_9FLAO|nr:hypothetical protein [Salinimicrobium marinum]GHA41926.1 hypothetical protein GCM10007103_24040 [Salinimicrobium marinum]